MVGGAGRGARVPPKRRTRKGRALRNYKYQQSIQRRRRKTAHWLGRHEPLCCDSKELRLFQMDPISSIKLRWLHGALHDVTYELARSQFSQFAPRTWEPAINAYRCEKSVRICVDLAGVERSQIDLTVESRRVVLTGTREL